MGFGLTVGSHQYEMTDFSVTEAATPLAGGDSSGQVGTIDLTVVKRVRPNEPAVVIPPEDMGAHMLVGRSVRLTDTNRGFTLGKVISVSDSPGGTFKLTCETRLGELNVYDVQTAPFRGTLLQAFRYYCGVAGITTDILVDPSIENRQVLFPGFAGELWYNLKQLTAALDVEISLVSGIILLRPIRQRTAIRGRDVDRNMSVGGQLAQKVEVNYYNHEYIVDKLVYPPGGWSPEVAVITVNAGEYIEEQIEFSASVSSVRQPEMRQIVPPGLENASVYTVTTDEGFNVMPGQWSAYGGTLRVEINPDTVSGVVKIQAPSGFYHTDGKTLVEQFSIALAADNHGTYSTLRIIGTGVAINKETLEISTGVPPSKTGTVVGATIDNPFVSTLSQAYEIGKRAAKQLTGLHMTLSGTVIAVNKLGESGVATYPTYDYVQNMLNGRTYDYVQNTLWAGKTYDQVQEELYAQTRNDFENQVHGNVNGARIFDKATARHYRIRSATIGPEVIQFEADDDLTYDDMQEKFGALTYDDVQSYYTDMRGNATYDEATLMGMPPF